MSVRVPLRGWPGERVEIRFRLVLSLVPAWLFLAVSRVAPPWASILVGFGATLFVYLATGHNRLVGTISTFGLAVVAISAAVGIAFESEKSYLAAGWIMDLLFVPMYAVSVVINKPFAGAVARELVPTIAGRIPLDAALYRGLSIFWALYYLAHGLVQAFLLRELSVAQFIIWSRIVLWPPTGLALAVSAALVWRAAKQSRGDAVLPGGSSDASRSLATSTDTGATDAGLEPGKDVSLQ
jgi:intracellular septation protein A